MRSQLKWYGNANGPKKKVLYGVKAAYPVINVINGYWVRDMDALRSGDIISIVRKPITRSYFTGTYPVQLQTYNLWHKALAYFNYLVLKPRGFQGGMVFTKRKLIEPRQYADYQKQTASGNKPEMVAPVEPPWP